FSSKSDRALAAQSSSLRDFTIRIPPRAISRNRRWKPLNSDEMIKNVPYGVAGYSKSGKNDASRRKLSATFVGV
ncbi:hypothetical protein KEM55_008677, partial [Ascosphaera atra]